MRLRLNPDHSLAYGPHAEANHHWVDAIAGSVVVRLQKTNGQGHPLREMHIELTPDRARAIAGVLLAKADEADQDR